MFFLILTITLVAALYFYLATNINLFNSDKTENSLNDDNSLNEKVSINDKNGEKSKLSKIQTSLTSNSNYNSSLNSSLSSDSPSSLANSKSFKKKPLYTFLFAKPTPSQMKNGLVLQMQRLLSSENIIVPEIKDEYNYIDNKSNRSSSVRGQTVVPHYNFRISKSKNFALDAIKLTESSSELVAKLEGTNIDLLKVSGRLFKDSIPLSIRCPLKQQQPVPTSPSQPLKQSQPSNTLSSVSPVSSPTDLSNVPVSNPTINSHPSINQIESNSIDSTLPELTKSSSFSSIGSNNSFDEQMDGSTYINSLRLVPSKFFPKGRDLVDLAHDNYIGTWVPRMKKNPSNNSYSHVAWALVKNQKEVALLKKKRLDIYIDLPLFAPINELSCIDGIILTAAWTIEHFEISSFNLPPVCFKNSTAATLVSKNTNNINSKDSSLNNNNSSSQSPHNRKLSGVNISLPSFPTIALPNVIPTNSSSASSTSSISSPPSSNKTGNNIFSSISGNMRKSADVTACPFTIASENLFKRNQNHDENKDKSFKESSITSMLVKAPVKILAGNPITGAVVYTASFIASQAKTYSDKNSSTDKKQIQNKKIDLDSDNFIPNSIKKSYSSKSTKSTSSKSASSLSRSSSVLKRNNSILKKFRKSKVATA